jgi:hypothetical protein
VEFHHHCHQAAGMDMKHTKEAVQKLNLAGFKIFHVSPSGEEYSFVKA